MSNKAVFVDRDRTLIDDPGYLSDPAAVKLLPGVDSALRMLSAAGYKIVVVTNQSGIARGLLTEETLGRIHAELRRQLGQSGIHLDGIYYCPFHPEGVIEKYTTESDLRKPQPGMLLRAAKELDIDLSESWMVGDSVRDVEAGQRAGCKTIRLRTSGPQLPGEETDEDVQADFTVRNMVDAARIVLRKDVASSQPQAAASGAGVPTSSPQVQSQPVAVGASADVPRIKRGPVRSLGVLAQGLALGALVVAVVEVHRGNYDRAIATGIISVAMQLMALTCFLLRRPK